MLSTVLLLVEFVDDVIKLWLTSAIMFILADQIVFISYTGGDLLCMLVLMATPEHLFIAHVLTIIELILFYLTSQEFLYSPDE